MFGGRADRRVGARAGRADEGGARPIRHRRKPDLGRRHHRQPDASRVPRRMSRWAAGAPMDRPKSHAAWRLAMGRSNHNGCDKQMFGAEEQVRTGAKSD